MVSRFFLPNTDEQYTRIEVAFSASPTLRGVRPYSSAQFRKRIEVFDKKHGQLLYCLNPYAGALWARYLCEALKCENPGALDVFTLTIFNPNWHLNIDEVVVGDAHHRIFRELLKKAELFVRNRLRGFGFLLMFDLAIHHTFDRTRKLLCLHAHGNMWGAEDEIRPVINQLEPGINGAPGGKLDHLYDRPVWFAYMAKDTRCRYATNSVNNSNLRRSEYLTREDLLLLDDSWGDLAKPEITFGSGVGAAIRRQAIRLAEVGGYRRYEGRR